MLYKSHPPERIQATVLLGWKPKHNLADDITEEVKLYESLGGTKESWTKEEQVLYDREVIASKEISYAYPF